MTLFSFDRRAVAGMFLWLLFLALPTAHAELKPGEILLGELNCVACHDAPPNVKARLASRIAPHLGADGLRVTPQWIIEFLTDPRKAKPGTSMPDMFQGVPLVVKAAAIEGLTHYLVSLQKPDTGTPAGYSIAAIDTGKRLYHSLGCVACHAPQEAPTTTAEGAPKSDWESLASSSVAFGNLAKKFTVNDLAAFLRDPLKAHPSGRMPSLSLTAGESRAIAMYLLRAQQPSGLGTKLSGLNYEYYEEHFPRLPRFEKFKPVATGIADNFTLSVAKRRNDYALKFDGTIAIPKDGEYTFYTESDDGSQLLIDEKKIADNDGVHPTQSAEGKVKLKAGAHNITVTYFDGGGQTELKVYWEGPGIEKQEIPSRVLSHDGQPMRPLDEENFVVDPVKAAKGKELFLTLNCAACHRLDIAGRKSVPLADLATPKTAGCLAAETTPNVPHYYLTPALRKDLAELLANQASLNQPLTPVEQVKRTMAALSCNRCHQRDGQGGPQGARKDYFVSSIDADLGDEGVLPPHLNGVGAKLKPEWIERVLWQGAAVRPYMATRMPQFGKDNVAAIAAAFVKADASAQSAPEIPVDEAAAKYGHKLIGTGGLSCVSCHVFAGHPSLGVPALDLTTVNERLKSDWFRRYLLNPQALRPGTRMPPFWPEGVAANKTILDGDSEKQIAAIWSYLAKGKLADLPEGLSQGKMELIAKDEPIIYRNFIAGAGTRAIGVGYPEKANLAFDANELRLALLWQGPFIDAARHRTGRGEGFEPPMGYNLMKLPSGAPLAVLASANAAWPGETGHDAGYQFHGYTLDDKERPTFRYTFKGAMVEEAFVPIPTETDAGFKRTISVQADAPINGLYFRAAAGNRIEDKGGNTYLIEGKLKLKFAGVKPVLRQSGNKSELLVPITFNGKQAQFSEEITW